MDHEQIEALVAVFQESPRLREIELRSADVRVRFRREAPSATRTPPARKATAPPPSSDEGASPPHASTITVTAQVVGLFQVLDPPIASGATVHSGQVLGHIETMRLLNDCVASASGIVRSVLVRDGQPVEYGQLLFDIEPQESL